MKAKNIISAFALLVIVSAGYAQVATPVVTDKQVNQQKRIANGIQTGELTPGEVAALEAREVKIQRDKRIAQSDGIVTFRERRKLLREERRTSRAIARQT